MAARTEPEKNGASLARTIGQKAQPIVLPDEVEEGQASKDLELLHRHEHARLFAPMVTLDVATALKPYLLQIPADWSKKTRLVAYRFIEFAVSGENWLLNQKQSAEKLRVMYPELGITHNSIRYLEWKWPAMWSVISVLVQKRLKEAESRVMQATLHHALHGTDRDRRLFFELQGKLKQKSAEGGGITFVFNNTSVQRPKVIEAEVVTEESSKAPELTEL